MKEQDLFVSQEKKIGLIRKWAVLLLGLTLLWFLYPETFIDFNATLFYTFAGIYFVYTLYVLFFAKGILFRIIWHSAFFIELVFLSFLLFYSKGMDSILFLFYPVIIMSNALVINKARDYFLAGFFGHLTYVFTLLVYYSSLNFYLESSFLLQSFLLAGFFVLGLVMIWRLKKHHILIHQLSESLENKEQKIDSISIIEEPTGLYKLGYFLQRLTEEIARAKRYKTSLCLLLMEVDYYENYNDKEAKPLGDVGLKQVARVLFRVTREMDICCHWQGNKLAVILPHTPSSGGIRLAERIRKEIEEQRAIGELPESGGMFTVAIGVGTFPINASSSEGLLKVTETALQMAIEEKKSRTRPHLSLIVDSPKKIDLNEELDFEKEVN